MYSVGGSKVGFFFDFFGFNDFVDFGRTLIGCVNNVDSAGTLTRNYREAPGFAGIVVAGTTSVPTKMM
jgi:hypothetical protein